LKITNVAMHGAVYVLEPRITGDHSSDVAYH